MLGNPGNAPIYHPASGDKEEKKGRERKRRVVEGSIIWISKFVSLL
jgi:hypothetical protein